MQGTRSGRCLAARMVILALAPLALGWAATALAQDAVRKQAEGLAEAASKEFNVILERQRVAQAEPPKAEASPAPKNKSEQLAPPPLGWLQYSSRQFQSLMQKLAGGSPRSQPWDPVADAEKKLLARQPLPRRRRNDVVQAPPAAKETSPKIKSAPPKAEVGRSEG